MEHPGFLTGRSTSRRPPMPERNDLEHMLRAAMLFQQQGRLLQAEQLYHDTLKIDPNNFGSLYYLGLMRAEQGRLDDSVKLFRKALGQDPNSFEAHFNIAIALEGLGRFPDVIAHCEKALAIRPACAEAHFTCANAWKALQHAEKAIAHYEKAIAINSRYAEAHYNLGNTLCSRKRYREAIAAYNKALAITPHYAKALNNRGVALQAVRRSHEALSSYDHALAIQPDYYEAMNNRGVALLDLRRHAEALTAFDQTLEMKRDHPEAWYSRGNALQALHRYPEALTAYHEALAIRPDYVEALNNQGNALLTLRRYDEALANFEKVLLLEPRHPYARTGAARAAAAVCDWERTAKVSGELPKLIEQGEFLDPFTLLAYCGDPALQLRCAQKTLHGLSPVPLPSLCKGHVWRNEKIRIAYLSTDFHQHPTAFLTAQLFEDHDRSRFDVLGFSFGPDDGSSIRGRLASAFDEFYNVTANDDAEAANLLHDLRVDIAVDLNGYTMGARPGILARRPAPIQVSYLVFPATMAADFIDYIIADPVVLPFDHQQFYTEKIVQLPESYQVNDRKRAIAAKAPTREAAGLPERGFVFCCFNNSQKITAPVFDIWMRLLRKIDGSVLWLLLDSDAAKRNLQREAAARKVDPARLVFAPRLKLEHHLARHRLADLFLDTLPYNAHTTASDALWAGLPVLTCLGRSFAGRVAASLLHAAGLPELVTESLEAYEALALQLATDRASLGDLRRRLRENRLICPLFDTDRCRIHIEAAYVEMWELWQRGDRPRSFTVEPHVGGLLKR